MSELRPGEITDEMRQSKTTEFFIYLASVVAVLIASMVVGTEEGHTDYFRADKAWLYIVVLTVGYMISRGLANGSRDPLRRVPRTRRGKAASGVLYAAARRVAPGGADERASRRAWPCPRALREERPGLCSASTPVRNRCLSGFFFGSGSVGLWLGAVCARETSSGHGQPVRGGGWGGAAEHPGAGGLLPR
jgi:hypothetical protein